MYHAIVVAILLLSPAILAVSLLFPFYWIGQYRLLRKTGSWILQKEFHHRWMKFMGRAVIVSYVLCLGAIFLPRVFSSVRAFLESGWMLGIAIPLALDMGVLMVLSPDTAAEAWRSEQKPRNE